MKPHFGKFCPFSSLSSSSLSSGPSSRRAFLRRALVVVAVAPLAMGVGRAAQAQSTEYPLGMVPSTPQDFARAARFVIRAKRGDARPPRVMLTEFLPPVKSQGKQNSCVSWSTAYYAYTYTVAQKRLLAPKDRKSDKFQFSPAFVYHLGNNGEDHGMPIPEAMAILKEKGCCSLAEMPYNDRDFTSPPSAETLQSAQKYTAVEYASLSKGAGDMVEKMKTFLADMQQPFVMGINVFKSFYTPDRDKPYNVPANPSGFQGRHAVTVIGYDDDKHAFRIINSWGEKWGDKGQLWLSEDFVAKNTVEAWGFIAGGPATRSLVRKPVLPASVSLSPPGK